MYGIEPDCVVVLAVMSGSRDLSNAALQPWEQL